MIKFAAIVIHNVMEPALVQMQMTAKNVQMLKMENSVLLSAHTRNMLTKMDYV